MAACGGNGSSGSPEPAVPAPVTVSAAGQPCSGPDDSGWCWRLPSRQATAPAGIEFANDTHGYLWDGLGAVFVTGDGGRTWSPVETPVPVEALVAAGPLDAWARKDKELMRTQDQGRTWQRIGTLPQGGIPERMIPFGANGLATGRMSFFSPIVPHPYEGAVTEDGGNTWHTLSRDFLAVSKQGSLWSLGGKYDFRYSQFGPLQVSHDGGLTYTDPLACCREHDVVDWSLEDDQGIAVVTADLPWGSAGRVLTHHSSMDGGRSMTAAPMNWPSERIARDISRIFLLPNGRAWSGLANSDGVITDVLYSRNGGIDWFTVGSTADAGLVANELVPLDGENIVAATIMTLSGVRTPLGAARFNLTSGRWDRVRVSGEPQDAVTIERRRRGGPLLAMFGDPLSPRWYASADQGRIWTALPGNPLPEPGRGVSISGLWFFDERQGLALRSDGQLLASEDGGRTWVLRQQLDDRPVATGSLHFTPDGRGWLVSGGLLYGSNDRGRTWSGVPIEGLQVYQAQFVDERNGWVRGQICPPGPPTQCDEVELRGTKDGGKTWTPLGIGIGPFHFASPDLGIVATRQGRILRTTDGGRSWDVASFPEELVNASQVLFRTTGSSWITNIGGLFAPPRYTLRSDDAGRTWREVPLPTDAAIEWPDETTQLPRGVFFVDAQVGWLVGPRGQVMRTDDGGDTWRRQKAGVRRDLMHLFALDRQHVWAAGGGPPVILSSSTGGD